MDKIAVLFEIDNGSSLAVMGEGKLKDFEKILRQACASKRLPEFIREIIDDINQRVASTKFRESGMNPSVAYLPFIKSSANIIANLTKNGITRLVDVPLRALSENDLYSPDRFRNFNNLDMVFIVENDGGIIAIKETVSNKLNALNIIDMYRDGVFEQKPLMELAA